MNHAITAAQLAGLTHAEVIDKLFDHEQALVRALTDRLLQAIVEPNAASIERTVAMFCNHQDDLVQELVVRLVAVLDGRTVRLLKVER